MVAPPRELHLWKAAPPRDGGVEVSVRAQANRGQLQQNSEKRTTTHIVIHNVYIHVLLFQCEILGWALKKYPLRFGGTGVGGSEYLPRRTTGALGMKSSIVVCS